jgi:uncharacterized protein YkwD
LPLPRRIPARPVLLLATLALTALSGARLGLPPAPAVAALRAANCDVDAGSIALDPEEQALLDDTNAYRAAYGLSSLQPSYALTVSALWKSNDMASRAYFAHDDGFRTWVQRLVDCGYDLTNRTADENLAAGAASASDTLAQFQRSPEHSANLLDPRMTAVGVKRVHASNPADPYGWYWAMDLGSALDLDLNAALAGP